MIARLAIWSAPALVVGATAGVTWQRATVPERVNTGYVERVVSPAVAGDTTAVQATSGTDHVPNESELPLVTASESPSLEPRKIAASTATATLASSAEPRAANQLARERAVLDRARVALAAGESERAHEETKRHAREFPNGILTEEREAIAINGLVRLGRYAQATQRAARFRARYPQSLMMHSVDAAMATAPRD